MTGVITINYNLSSETIPCVDSVLASGYQDFLIFLVDNGSKLADYNKLLKEFGSNSKIKILRIERNCGYVNGINFGLKNAMEINPDYLLVMNNDTVIDKEAIGHLVNVAKKYGNKAIISGKVYYFDYPDILQHAGEIITDHRFHKVIYPGKNEKDTGQFDKELERDTLDDVFWLIPENIIKDVGLYCDYFFLYAEQADYSLRALHKGYKLIFTPEAKIWHKVSMTSGGGNVYALPICYWRGQGLFLMHYRHIKTVYFILLVIKVPLIMLLKSVFKNKEERKCVFAQLRGYLWGFGWMLNKKPNDGQNPYLSRE